MDVARRGLSIHLGERTGQKMRRVETRGVEAQDAALDARDGENLLDQLVETHGTGIDRVEKAALQISQRAGMLGEQRFRPAHD